MQGKDLVAMTYIGDGGTSTGDFHEGLNLASVLNVPFVLIAENNGWAYSTPTSRQMRVKSIATRAAAYGIPGEAVDGNDVLAVYEATKRAVERARSGGGGPTLIEARTFRMKGHAEHDDAGYVPKHMFEEWKLKDPIERFERHLLGNNLATEDDLEGDHGEDRRPAQRRGRLRPRLAHAAARAGVRGGVRGALMAVTYLEAIRQALWDEMEKDERVFMLGQDIGTYGGAFRVTAGFLDKFGPGRIIDTPISESAMVGAAIGAAMMGLLPVVEMQFIDFISCAFNQIINFAAPNHYRWGQKVPLVVRGPSGGNVHGSAYHSQNPESYFQHTPGLKILAPGTVADAYGLMKAAIRDPNPVLYFEHKYLYRRLKDELPEGDGVVEIGKARVAREGRDLSVITYGAMLQLALEAAGRLEADGIDLEVIDLRTIKPLDQETILASVRKTSRVIVLTEEQLTGSVAGEVAARISQDAFQWLDGPVHRLCCPDTPVPFSPTLEEAYLPNVDKLVAKVRELSAY